MKLPVYKKFTISRFLGVLPFATTGFTQGLYKILSSIEKHKLKTIFFSVLIYKTISNHDILTNLKGVTYYGIHKNLQALCMIFVFTLFPSDKIKNYVVKKPPTISINHSAGVFYLHMSVLNYFKCYFEDIKKGIFLGIIINYFICYYICSFGILIFGKTQFKYLFS